MSPLLFKRLRIGDSQQLPGLDEAQPESGATSGFEVGVQQPGLTSLRLEMNRFHRTAPVTTSKVALLPYRVLERLSASLSACSRIKAASQSNVAARDLLVGKSHLTTANALFTPLPNVSPPLP